MCFNMIWVNCREDISIMHFFLAVILVALCVTLFLLINSLNFCICLFLSSSKDFLQISMNLFHEDGTPQVLQILKSYLLTVRSYSWDYHITWLICTRSSLATIVYHHAGKLFYFLPSWFEFLVVGLLVENLVVMTAKRKS